MRIVADPLHIAIDGNEANVESRVGSNVYAHQVLTALEQETRTDPTIACTVLLASPKIPSLPPERNGWRYHVVKPRKFWTQWALPLHLFAKRSIYDVFFTPGHYAPRIAPIPYVSAVMDTAYLDYPEQFTAKDRAQLTNWTRYSVRNAKKILSISKYTQQSITEHYHRQKSDIFVAYPAIHPLTEQMSQTEKQAFFAKHSLTEPYFLFVGTLQPRKNLERLVTAYEQFRSKLAQTEKLPAVLRKKGAERYPQLVLAGKVGWMAEPIIERIKRSQYAKDIRLTGFISDVEKKTLYSTATAVILVGLHEGFGIPPLEAMRYGSIPIVANTTSLPEVVGKAGVLVDPTSVEEISEALWSVYTLTAKERAVLLKEGRAQAAQFSWKKTAQTILKTLLTVVDHTYYRSSTP